MKDSDSKRVENFLHKWKNSSGNEIANKDAFCLDLCTALAVAPPPPQGSIPGDPYYLEKADRKYNDKALVSILKQIHDELDAAVFAAYGWEPNLSDDEILSQLVTLNAERYVGCVLNIKHPMK